MVTTILVVLGVLLGALAVSLTVATGLALRQEPQGSRMRADGDDHSS